MGAMSSYPVRTRCWRRKEYDRLIDLGILHEDEPIELLAGQMLVAEPKTPLDSTAIGLAGDALRVAFGDGWLVCTHNPIALDDESEPEPDVMVIAGQIRDYRDTHPERAALVVEVALSSLAFDRRHKGQPLRACRRRRLLDREPGRSRRGGAPPTSTRSRRRFRRRVSRYRARAAGGDADAAGQARGARGGGRPATLG